jgi:hypothetical protein
MAWPPPVLPINRTNATPQLDTHAQDHNALAQAINDTAARLGAADRLGVVAQTVSPSPTNGFVNSYYDLVGGQLTYTAVAGRLYKVTAALSRLEQVGAQATVSVQVADGGGATIRLAEMVLASGFFGQLTITYLEVPPAGATTRKLQAKTSAGNLNIIQGSLLMVEDVGRWPIT